MLWAFMPLDKKVYHRSFLCISPPSLVTVEVTEGSTESHTQSLQHQQGCSATSWPSLSTILPIANCLILATFEIWVGWEFSKSSFFGLNGTFPQSLFLHIFPGCCSVAKFLYIRTRRNQLTPSTLCSENSSAKYPSSSHKFCFPHNSRTQFS